MPISPIHSGPGLPCCEALASRGAVLPAAFVGAFSHIALDADMPSLAVGHPGLCEIGVDALDAACLACALVALPIVTRCRAPTG